MILNGVSFILLCILRLPHLSVSPVRLPRPWHQSRVNAPYWSALTSWLIFHYRITLRLDSLGSIPPLSMSTLSRCVPPLLSFQNLDPCSLIGYFIPFNWQWFVLAPSQSIPQCNADCTLAAILVYNLCDLFSYTLFLCVVLCLCFSVPH